MGCGLRNRHGDPRAMTLWRRKGRINREKTGTGQVKQVGFLPVFCRYHCWALSGTTHSHQQAALPLFPFSLSLEFLPAPACPACPSWSASNPTHSLPLPSFLLFFPLLSFLSLSHSLPPSYNPRFDCSFQFPLFLISLPICLSFSFLPIATAIDLVRLISGDTQPKP